MLLDENRYSNNGWHNNCCGNNWNNDSYSNNVSDTNNFGIDTDDCSYEPTGINAQFGYNTEILFNKNCMNNQTCCKERDEIGEEMLSKIRCLKFAITDLGEYLNTHPDDEKALCLHREYSQSLRELSDKYQKVYGPLSIYFPCNSWRWLEEPWPWERSER